MWSIGLGSVYSPTCCDYAYPKWSLSKFFLLLMNLVSLERRGWDVGYRSWVLHQSKYIGGYWASPALRHSPPRTAPELYNPNNRIQVFPS